MSLCVREEDEEGEEQDDEGEEDEEDEEQDVVEEKRVGLRKRLCSSGSW